MIFEGDTNHSYFDSNNFFLLHCIRLVIDTRFEPGKGVLSKLSSV